MLRIISVIIDRQVADNNVTFQDRVENNIVNFNPLLKQSYYDDILSKPTIWWIIKLIEILNYIMQKILNVIIKI